MQKDWILWDVIEQHLEEGVFHFLAWTRALDSPRTLADLERWPEGPLLAHIDGLAVGGEPVARRLLECELDAPKRPRFEQAATAALALLAQDRNEIVRAALGSSHADVRRGVARALVLHARGNSERLLRELSAAPELRCRSLPEVENLLWRSEPAAWDAALVTALEQGSSAAFQDRLELAGDPDTPQEFAMLLLALLGGPAQVFSLVQHLERPTHRCAALRALGFAGHVSVVPALLSQLTSSDPTAARLAAEAISSLTGLDLHAAPPPPEPDSLPPLEEDDLDGDLVPGAEEQLPLPHPAAVTELWRQRGPSFDARVRLLEGQPWTLARAAAVLGSAPMRRRHPVALWLQIRTAGVARVDTRALSQVQRQDLVALQRLSEAALVRHFASA